MLAELKQGKKNFEKKQQITSMLNMHSQEREGSTHANKHWLVGAVSEQNKKLQNMEAKTNARCCKQTANLWQQGN